MRRKTAKKEFTYTWAFEAFDRDPTFCQKRMFGGLAAYVQGRMVMVLTENPGERSYRKKLFIELEGYDFPHHHPAAVGQGVNQTIVARSRDVRRNLVFQRFPGTQRP